MHQQARVVQYIAHCAPRAAKPEVGASRSVMRINCGMRRNELYAEGYVRARFPVIISENWSQKYRYSELFPTSTLKVTPHDSPLEGSTSS